MKLPREELRRMKQNGGSYSQLTFFKLLDWKAPNGRFRANIVRATRKENTPVLAVKSRCLIRALSSIQNRDGQVLLNPSLQMWLSMKRTPATGWYVLKWCVMFAMRTWGMFSLTDHHQRDCVSASTPFLLKCCLRLNDHNLVEWTPSAQLENLGPRLFVWVLGLLDR